MTTPEHDGAELIQRDCLKTCVYSGATERNSVVATSHHLHGH